MYFTAGCTSHATVTKGLSPTNIYAVGHSCLIAWYLYFLPLMHTSHFAQSEQNNRTKVYFNSDHTYYDT